MAEVVGGSGAWSDLAGEARSQGHHLETPDDVAKHLLIAKQSLRAFRADSRAEVLQAKAILDDWMIRRDEETGLLRAVTNRVRIGVAKSKLASKRRLLQQKLDSKAASVAYLERLPTSRKMAGVRAEQTVIDELSKLPDQYTILNNIRLRAAGFLHNKGDPVGSAQIDHVVVSSRGIILVETKHWSTSFGLANDFFDPYQQVQRASLLLYVTLANSVGKVRVKSVIASSGWLPPKPSDAFVQVVPPHQLRRRIESMKDDKLSPRAVANINKVLAAFVAR